MKIEQFIKESREFSQQVECTDKELPVVTLQYANKVGLSLSKALNILEAMQSGIVKVLGDGVQETKGMRSWKHNKCKHDRYGYEGCEDCIDEHLQKVLSKCEELCQ